MTGLLLAALERLPRGVRRFVVAIVALLALGAVMVALTLSTPDGGRERGPTPRRSVAAGSPRSSRRRLPPPVSTLQLVVARRVAKRFLAGYLLLAYGHAGASAFRGVTPSLRRQLRRGRAQLTPAERGRRPRVVSLQTIGTTPAFVVATAVVDDRGVSAYRLRFTLRRRAGRWAVSSVEAG